MNAISGWLGWRLIQPHHSARISIGPAGDLQPFLFGLLDQRFLLPFEVQRVGLKVL